jgi:DNA end-binding protein Ku
LFLIAGTGGGKMASRAVWKGQLRLSLVSIPVEMHSATASAAKIAFRQIHEPTGKPIKYEKVVRGVGPVDASEIVKGYEYEKDKYVLLDPDEVDAIKLETKKTLELVQFVGACEIPPLYFDKPYYLVPTDELAEDAYRVVRDALRQSEKIGLGQVTLRGKEHLAAVKACGDGLLLETLHYDEDLRSADPLFAGISDDKVDDDLLAVARQLIERKTAPFDAAAYKDRYASALTELLDAKISSRGTKRVSTGPEPAEPGAENVVDLMAALKASLEKSGGKSAGSKSAGAKSAKKPAPASASAAKRRAPGPRKKAS